MQLARWSDRVGMGGREMAPLSGQGARSALCGQQLSADDRKAWQQAIALLIRLKKRNGFGEQDLTAVVGAALRHSSTTRTCADCDLKQATFGLPSEHGPKKRWCAGCAKDHAGAVDVTSKKCEGCGLAQASFGLPSNKKPRWCGGCAKRHAGAVDVIN